MRKENFEELLASIKEAGKISRGEIKPSRQFTVESKKEVAEVRESFNISQSQFAKFMGVSINTLQNWEQGRRRPTGPARVLLRIISEFPDVFEHEYSNKTLAFA